MLLMNEMEKRIVETNKKKKKKEEGNEWQIEEDQNKIKYILPLGKAIAIVLSSNNQLQWNSFLLDDNQFLSFVQDQKQQNTFNAPLSSTIMYKEEDNSGNNLSFSSNLSSSSLLFGLKSIYLQLKNKKKKGNANNNNSNSGMEEGNEEEGENMCRVISILMEKIVIPKEQSNVSPFLNWLSIQFDFIFVVQLKEMLRRNEKDKKRLLALLLLISKTFNFHSSSIQSYYSDQNTIMNCNKRNDWGEREEKWIRVCNEYASLLETLSNIIINHSVKDGVQIKATRLTVVSSDLFFSIVSLLPSHFSSLIPSVESYKISMRPIHFKLDIICLVINEMIKVILMFNFNQPHLTNCNSGIKI
eukprot:TRINITY_DN8786_c0_g1_i1.p2 TRINITY_DN8786_c0_g1~~TRINITY_DN8786_c0_g1_i1.p2  ORF type:complete len:357 (+),score=98.72 TRINITY_DN8786_c0_g1_i1:154-1224(+)